MNQVSGNDVPWTVVLVLYTADHQAEVRSGRTSEKPCTRGSEAMGQGRFQFAMRIRQDQGTSHHWSLGCNEQDMHGNEKE